jgi:3-oxoacyl-[acyl-carrier protein] reductase
MDRLLENKVAIVTGGSQGLGLSVAFALAADGAKCVLTSRSEDRARRASERVEAAGGVACPCVVDLLEPTAADLIVETAVERYGKVDIVVNAAGFFLWKPFLEVTREEWGRAVATDLVAPFALAQAASRVMADRAGGGAIVNVASIHGLEPEAGAVAQCATKAGVIGLTRALAEALRPFDIRVNAVAPGAIEPDSAFRRSESIRSRITQGDVAGLVVYLASDLARGITGAVIAAGGATRVVIKD